MRVKTGFEMTLSYVLHTIFRFAQLVLALTVCGLYGMDLNKDNGLDDYTQGRWVYAVIVGSFSAVTAVIYMIPFVSRIAILFVWDTILFILWIALFGVFGSMYIHENTKGHSGAQRMKNAVWVDLTNALLWLISAVGMIVVWLKSRNTRTQWTGRAIV